MQAVENLTRLRGRILMHKPHPQREGYELLTVRVEETEPVPEKADLLKQHCGQILEVAVRQALLPDALTTDGAFVDLRAKMTQDGALAEPYPEPGNFTIDAAPLPPL